MKNLLLFDIDGTLINAGGAGRRALKKALDKTFGDSRPIDMMDFSGQTDSGILLTILSALGVSAILHDRNYNTVAQLYLTFLQDELDLSAKKRIMPGIPELLAALKCFDHCHLGLLTGNFEAGARMKLGHFDLNGYFPVGGFSDNLVEREAVAASAAASAATHYKYDYSTENVYVIGDTEKDITCGKANGYKTIAVATGSRSAAQLQQHQPNYLFESFADIEPVLAIFRHSETGTKHPAER